VKQQTSSKGFAILSFASIVCKVLSFVYLPIQAMLVHDSGNGVISAGFKLYIFIYTLTNAGLPVIISKFVSERMELGDYRGSRAVFRSAFTLMMSFGLLASLFTYFGSGLLAAWCQMSEAKLMFMVIAPTFLFTSLSSSMRGYFQGRHNMTPTAVSQIVEQIINSALTAILEILFFNVALKAGRDTVTYTAAGSALATALAAAGSALFLAFLFTVIHGRGRKREIATQEYDGPTLATATIYKQLLRYSIPAIVSCLAASATDIIDTRTCVPLLMAGNHTQLEAYALFGIYSTKYQRLMTLPVMFAAPLVTAMVPALSAAMARRDFKAFRQQIREGYKINYLVVLPIVAGLTFLAKPILTVIFAAQNNGALLIILWTWTAIFVTLQSLQSGILVALGRPLVAPVNVLIGMAFKLLCNYLLIPIPALNIHGALIGNMIAWIISIALNRVFIGRIMRKKQRMWPFMILPALASVVMGVLCFVVYVALFNLLLRILPGQIAANAIAVLVTIPFGALVYFTVLIRSGGLTGEDLKRLPMGRQLGGLCRRVPFLRKALEPPREEKKAAETPEQQ
jgi:stage V sporulation protein B